MNLREIRKKIKSVKNIKKITKAMQLVSAVKMKKAVQTATAAKEYQDRVRTSLGRVFESSNEAQNHPLIIPRDGNKELVILVTSNKGLCGSLNINLLRKVAKEYKTADVSYTTIGKKGAQFVAGTKQRLIADFSDGTPLDDAGAITTQIMDMYRANTYDHVYLAYNSLVSSMKSEPVIEGLLPFDTTILATDTNHTEYIIEPQLEAIQTALLESYVEERVRYAIISNVAAEHSARMIAMKNATDNASDLIDNLTLVRNQVRQEKITGELLDLVTAANSVTSS